jgi:glycosyltransferase involved in cell wall biosynthesis
MPVYNSELYIKEAIDSILNQTFTDFEFIIIDDASTDKSVEIIQSYTDSRIQLIVKSHNSGYTNSLNHGLTIARGDYIARMDSDDISMPTRFEKQVAFLDANTNYVLCGANFSIIHTGEIKYLPEDHDAIQMQFIHSCCMAHPSVMLRNKVLQDNFITYDVNKEPAEDYDLWVRLLPLGKLYNLQEVLLQYRVHALQTSNVKAAKQTATALEIKINLFKYLKPNFSFEEKKVYQKFLLHQFITIAELSIFKKINSELIKSNNKKVFFNTTVFTSFLQTREKQLLFKYFYNRKKYHPILLLKYFKNKNKLQKAFSTIDLFKFIIKCLLFHTSKNK